MPMARAGNQEAIGDYLYFFRSPVAGTRQCLIFGHAGWVPRLGDKFTLPAGITLNFRSWHGSPNTSNPTREVLTGGPRFDRDAQRMATQGKAARMLLDNHEKKDFVGGESVCNYIIVKGLGKHWDKKNPNDSSYMSISGTMNTRAAANGNCPHFVSVRSRSFWGSEKYQLLGGVINAVVAHEPAVNQFIMAGCRGVHPDWNP